MAGPPRCASRARCSVHGLKQESGQFLQRPGPTSFPLPRGSREDWTEIGLGDSGKAPIRTTKYEQRKTKHEMACISREPVVECSYAENETRFMGCVPRSRQDQSGHEGAHRGGRQE